MSKPATSWQLVPAAPTQDWTNAFAARGPRIGTFDTTIRDVLATAPAPDVDVVQELQAVRAALAFLPPGDAAVAGLDRIIHALDVEPNRASAAQGDQHGEQRREAVMEAIAGALGSAYDCVRAWSAWSHGTMGPDDFALVAEDSDRLAELADAAIAAMCPASGAGDALTAAARDVLAERERQISVEGWSTHHDDAYTGDQLALAASCYALPPGEFEIPGPPQQWPWPSAWWKPGDRRRELVKAGALILAEIERLDRAAIAAQQGKGEAA
ncbi:hypothetical protein B9P52_32045 [Achromobacter denitrificans]|uniref:hypothetical protein n=1 Tax=Achromobacter denitrificans TaxID=32002 RepID=UPI000B4DADB4|nr:hypothetical protein [Achromobacter denitrificans]ASC68626.1 hypothetical protein B9P52_32045 [Achromobacter denitrificans]